MFSPEDSTPVIYTKPQCVQCDMTIKLMNKLGVKYHTVDLSTNEEALATVKDMGYMSAPVIVVNEDNHWSGFRMDKVKSLSEG